MREIVTLQLGNLANYVGTHFWNTQEEYFIYGSDPEGKASAVELDHDILYRAGLTPTGTETYTPRVLIYDLKGGFGSLQKYNQLFTADVNDTVDWDQGVNKVVSDQYPKNAYQQQLERMEVDPNAEMVQLDDRSVKTWSDFNRIYYHPRSMNQVTTHNMDDSIMPYNTYPVGRQSYSDYERETESFEDNFRRFVEECDNLQGFQVFAGIDDAFSGFTEGLLHDVRDEFAKTPILCYGLQSTSMPAQERAKQRVVLNRSLSMTRILDLCTTYVPLYTPSPAHIRKSKLFPYIHPNCNSLYHTSAILSAAIETVSLAYRVKSNLMTIGDLCYKMNGQGTTRLSGISASLPLPFLKDGFDATHNLFKNSIAPAIELSKLVLDKSSSNVFAEDVIVRGLPRASVHAHDKGLYEYTRSLYHKFSHTEPRFIDNIPYPLPNSYPQFFTPKCDINGFLSKEQTTETLNSVPILSRMYTGPELCPEIDNLVKQVESAPFRQMSDYSEGKYGLAYADYLELKEGLMHLSDAYSEDTELMLE
ncbi:tubulin domain-containing protein [Fennellomyces sp. T-0311]|nr:tubulin domain-containing protein [Fennellomyces sp. T-0311]